jgi:ABC-type Fe3+/spermidine/putrescine transport system ATPase subunit
MSRAIGMVFQSYAIWPHFDVFVNVAYPLQVQRPRLDRHEIEACVMKVLALVGMADMARRPATRALRRQQQRVALAPRDRAPARPSCCSTSRSPTSTRGCARARARSCRS